MWPLPLLVCLLLALLPRSALPAPTAEPEPTSIVVDLVPLALASGLLLKGEHLAFVQSGININLFFYSVCFRYFLG